MTKTPNHIFIMLGAACNMKCRHCLQCSMPTIHKKVAKRTLDFLSNLAGASPKRIGLTFWGGEPLLYRPAMHEIVSTFGDKFAYGMVSNGALLTDADVEYFNMHNIAYTHSNDGPDTAKTGRTNMLEDPEFVERFKRLNIKSIEAVQHAYNQDLETLYKYVSDKLGGLIPGVGISVDDLRCTGLVPADYAEFSPGAMEKNDKFIRSVVTSALQGETPANDPAATHAYYEFVKRILDIDRQTKNCDNQHYKCGPFKTTLNMDTDGNFYLCHNTGEKVGDVSMPLEDVYANIRKREKEIRDATLEAKGCLTCPVFQYCRGGCPLEKPSEMQRKACVAKVARWQTIINTAKDLGVTDLP